MCLLRVIFKVFVKNLTDFYIRIKMCLSLYAKNISEMKYQE